MDDLLKIQKLLNDYQTQQHIKQLSNQVQAIAGVSVVPVEPFTLEQTLNIINLQPQAVRDLMEYADASFGPIESVAGGAGFVGENFGDNVDLSAILETYNFTPSQIHLAAKDYRQIRKYLKGKKALTDLTPDQQRIIDTLRAKDEQFFAVGKEGGYTFKEDGVRFRNLRQQLLKRLNIDDTLPTSAAQLLSEREDMLPEYFDIKSLKDTPSIKPLFEKPGPGLIELQNLKPPDVTVPELTVPAVKPALIELQPLVDPNAFLHDVEWGNTTFDIAFPKSQQRQFDTYGTETFSMSKGEMRAMFLDSQNITTNFRNVNRIWDQYLRDAELVEGDFKDLFARWDEKVDDAFEKHLGGDTGFKMHPESEIELQKPKPKPVPEEGIEVEKPTPVAPFVEDHLVEPPSPFEAPVARPAVEALPTDQVIQGFADIDAELSLIDRYGKNWLKNIIALDQAGHLFLDGNKWAELFEDHALQLQNVLMIPAMNTIQGLVESLIPGSSRWINIGLGALDLIGNINPLGLAIQGVIELVQEMNIQKERTKENDFAQSTRGSRYGFFKDENGDWKPSIMNVDVKSEALGSRRQVFSIEYGDQFLWRDDGFGGVYPFFINEDGKKHEMMVTEPDMYLKDEAPQGSDPWYTAEFLQKMDPLRRWFFLSPTQMANVFTAGDAEDVLKNMEQYIPTVDESDYSKYTRNVMDWQKVIELNEKIRYGDDSNITMWDPTTGLRRVTTEDQNWGYRSMWLHPDLQDGDSLAKHMKNMDLPEESWLIDEYLPKQIQALVQTQKRMAEEQGLEETFGVDPIWEQYYNQGKAPPPTKANKFYTGTIPTHYASQEGQTSWSAMAMGFEHDLPSAESYEQLTQQIDQIGKYEESKNAKNYYQQKAITRYFVNELMDRGRGDDLYEAIIAKNNPTQISQLLMGQDNAKYGTYMLPWQNQNEQSDMLVGRDSEALTSGVFEPYQQKPYDAWKKARDENFISDQVWETHFAPTTEQDKRDIEKAVDDLQKKADHTGEAPWLRYQNSWIPNPKYQGDPVPRPDKDVPKPDKPAKPDREAEKAQHKANRAIEKVRIHDERQAIQAAKNRAIRLARHSEADQGLDDVSGSVGIATKKEFEKLQKAKIHEDKIDSTATDWEQAVIYAGLFGGDPMSYYPIENDGMKPEESDWDTAKNAAKKFGGDPIDYYPFENDGTRPFDYLPPEVLEYEEPVRVSAPVDLKYEEPVQKPAPVDLPVVKLSKEENYMQEMHATDYLRGVTTQTAAYIPTTKTGETALYGDRALHDALGLPEFITAAADPMGIVHQMYHPELVNAPFASVGHVAG